ncbi:site-specific DNA-methyltransferase [Billgrantia desiderata]|uniref:site-specific DNA-methyltransferase n=1 Tax=Billgrantia desiderata TaxID=52021 RepID=UPI00174E47E6|nr:site-specific DNA-methyltransferase [Halomonas desiderata]MCE8028500.1 site-specific DNA-methyltransferase [Halomonas desiderata]NIC36430.1 site-specific DNA-methyltransferase [Halomonas desiderata]
MSIEKLKTKTDDLSLELARAIAELVPDVLTETRDRDGRLQQTIDFSLLRQALGDAAADEQQERYQLDWPGKRAALREANAPIRMALRPAERESVDFAHTRNLFIEGDNLDALKLLRESYLGQVDVIYIDPPYNTGSDLIYNDRFITAKDEYLVRSGQVDEAGGRLVANLQSNGRFHSDWLSMMYPRLRLARQLLAESGILFISIDDNERANLEKLCEEIFGGGNFLGCFVWKRRSGAMDAVTNLSEDHEYVLVYAKAKATLKGVERTFEKYANPDDDPRGPWISDNLSAGKPGGDTHYAIRDPATGNEFWPPKGRYWPYSRTTMAQKIAEGRVIFPKQATGTPMLKRFAAEAMKPTIPVSSWIERPGAGNGQSTLVSPMNSAATRALKELLGEKLFSFPKPVDLIKALIEQGGSRDALVLDFFAGSATTAQAVMECNASDGGNRRYILVQLPEALDERSEAAKRGFHTIAELSRERIRRAAAKVLEGQCHDEWRRDVGFRVLKVDSTNMKELRQRPEALAQGDLLDAVDSVKPGRSAEDLLFQVLVDWGLDLTLPIARAQVQGKTLYRVADDALLACFDLEITEALIEELAGYKPRRLVLRDSAFDSDAMRINVEQQLRQFSPATELRVL